MFCKYCGKELENDATVCPNCGTPVANAPEQAPQSSESYPGQNEQLFDGSTVQQPGAQSAPNAQPSGQYGQNQYGQNQYGQNQYGQQGQQSQQVPPYYYQPSQYSQQPQSPEPQSNGIAIAGFVCAFISPLLGWIFGGIGLSRANRRNGKGKGFSIAAIAVASVMFVISLMLL